jgi:glycosyltransferase involved in cell wall biosynthesis
MARSLVADEHNVTMVCASFAGSTTGLTGPFRKGRREGTVDGIDVIEFDLSYSNRDGLASRVVKFVGFALRSVIIALRHDYDVVFASSTPLTVALPGIAAKALRGKPFVFEVRDLWPELPRAMGMTNPVLLGTMAMLERMSYGAADRVIGLAPGIVEGIVAKGKARQQVAMIPNGCDFDLFDPIAPRHPSELFPNAIAPHDFVAIFAGAHGKANGLDAVLDAAAVLGRRRRHDIKILLIGQGSEKVRLQQDAATRGLDNVVFVDVVPKTEAAALIKGSGVGLQVLADVPAFYDGTSPNKMFDYLSAGRAILINYPGWLAELVTSRGCGIAVPPGDADRFADALEHFADDQAARLAMEESARATGGELFDRREQAHKFKAVIKEAAGEGGARAAR